MKKFSALLAICVGNSPVPGEFPAQRPVTRNFDVFFDLCLNKPLSKQWWDWWFETQSCLLWCQCDEYNAWCPEFLHHQVISIPDIHYSELTDPCLPWGKISTTCAISVLRKWQKIKVYFASLKLNLAWQGLDLHPEIWPWKILHTEGTSDILEICFMSWSM